jgi:hypothetical protein
MHIRNDTATQQELELARRFSQLRREVAMDLPEIPDQEELAARTPVGSKDWLYRAIPKVALALVVTVTSIVLLNRSSAPDPGAVYADIMAANAVATDQLMSATLGTLPETFSTDGVDEFDLLFGEIQSINQLRL